LNEHLRDVNGWIEPPARQPSPVAKAVDGQPFQPRLVHVIINPAAGQDAPLLGSLNTVFKEHGVDWQVFITKDMGDARRFAADSASAGVDAVIACGGDGTVTEVACGLLGSGIPLGILPWGSANVMSIQLGIPADVALAAELVAGGRNRVQPVDMAAYEDTHFLLRATIGAGARIINNTPRESKNRWGNLAYVLTGLSELAHLEPTRYYLNIDGLHVEVDGITAFVGNSMNVGLPGRELVHGVDVGDGMLDVVLIRSGDLPSLLAIATNTVFNRPHDAAPILHWQARDVKVAVEPPQPTEVDGEERRSTPFHARVVPSAVRILCPAQTVEENNG
jgi:YegS/Rv2252/BmrU family lipid kinase